MTNCEKCTHIKRPQWNTRQMSRHCIKLEHIADKYLKSREISPGYSFPIPLGNRMIITFSFYEKSMRALVFQHETEKLEVLIREDEFGPAAIEKEHTTLDAVSRLLKKHGGVNRRTCSKRICCDA